MWCYFFFFKQKTAYEMRISDWSSDVCSSDLYVAYIVTPWAANRWVKRPAPTGGILDDGSEAESEANTHEERKPDKLRDVYLWLIKPLQERSSARRALMIGAILALLLSAAQGGWQFIRPSGGESGRASCRERVCEYV